jgi:hypothetical protein
MNEIRELSAKNSKHTVIPARAERDLSNAHISKLLLKISLVWDASISRELRVNQMKKHANDN